MGPFRIPTGYAAVSAASSGGVPPEGRNPTPPELAGEDASVTQPAAPVKRTCHELEACAPHKRFGIDRDADGCEQQGQVPGNLKVASDCFIFAPVL